MRGGTWRSASHSSRAARTCGHEARRRADDIDLIRCLRIHGAARPMLENPASTIARWHPSFNASLQPLTGPALCLDPPGDPCCTPLKSHKKTVLEKSCADQGNGNALTREDSHMRLLLSAAFCLILSIASPASAQDPVAERAVAGAKDYVKAKNLKDPKLTILLSSLYNNSFPDFTKKWEELTGVKFEIVPLGYTDIPAKVMQEAVSKTGVYDIFNDFPYTMPDAAGAKVILPLDDWVAKYKPDFSGIADGLQVPAVLRRQALHAGQRRRPPAAGRAQGPAREPPGAGRVQGEVRQGSRLPGHHGGMEAAGRVLQGQGRRDASGASSSRRISTARSATARSTSPTATSPPT